MTTYDATLAERKRQRRIARRIEALVVLIVIGAVLAVVLLYHPGDAHAGSYVHLDACKSSLRGGGGSDDDIHNAGVSSGATSFAGWSSSYTRVSATNLYVKGLLKYPGGYYLWFQGHCWDRDFGPDSFS